MVDEKRNGEVETVELSIDVSRPEAEQMRKASGSIAQFVVDAINARLKATKIVVPTAEPEKEEEGDEEKPEKKKKKKEES